MPYKKLTDNEIIKALECCQTQYDKKCRECPYEKYKSHSISTTTCSSEMRKDLLDLINRQKAEIERLNAVVDKADAEVGVLLEKLNATIAGQETLQKYIAEKNAEIEKLKSGKMFFCLLKTQKTKSKPKHTKKLRKS